MAQRDSLHKKEEPYDRREEILWDNKRYRKYNNYVTLGGGFLQSSIRSDVSKAVAFDFQFHIRRQNFQIGMNMSGPEWLSNNNIQGHVGYGKRWERNQSNFAAFGGIIYYTGVQTFEDSTGVYRPEYYQGTGIYVCGQAVTKLSFDIGAGVEVFAEYSGFQQLAGIKFILFFSGAYRGVKKNFNPHVRSENRK